MKCRSCGCKLFHLKRVFLNTAIRRPLYRAWKKPLKIVNRSPSETPPIYWSPRRIRSNIFLCYFSYALAIVSTDSRKKKSYLGLMKLSIRFLEWNAARSSTLQPKITMSFPLQLTKVSMKSTKHLNEK